MTNIIFDGNYLFYKTMFAIKHSLDKKGKPFLSLKDQRQSFLQKISTDMAYAIRQFGNPDRIIFTIDDSSWRKDVKIEENEGYKSGRSHGDEIDWDSFYKCMNDYAKILENKGIIVSRIEKAEGDDLMYFWSQVFLLKNENTIVITGDKDMHQIVRATKNNYTVIFDNNSKRRSIYAAHGLQNWLNESKNSEPDVYDMFSQSTYTDSSSDLIENALKKIKITEINPIEFILQKILTGDDGDDVPGIFYWPTKNGKKVNRITPKRADSILNHIRENIDYPLTMKNIEEHVDLLVEGLKKVTKVKEIDPEKIKKKLNRNMRLVYLHKEFIPKKIFEDFKDHVKQNINKTLGARSYYKNVFIEDTQYDKPPEAFTDSIFSALDKK